MKLTARNIGFGTLALLGLILAFAPVDQTTRKTVSMQEMMKELQTNDYYVTADELAHWIIDKQPGIAIVDIRSDEDYVRYHIPGNAHIPFSQLSKSKELQDLKDADMIILASNGNTKAAQAWILLREMGFDNIYVLQGGINYWVKAFSNPQKPQGFYSDDELFVYQFRKAAGPAMMGTKVAAQSDDAVAQRTKPKVRIRKKKAVKVDEGC